MTERAHITWPYNPLLFESDTSTVLSCSKVIVTQVDRTSAEIHECLNRVPVLDCFQHGQFVLQKLLIKLKNVYNFELEGKDIAYYLESEGIWLECGSDPICSDIRLSLQECLPQRTASTIRIRATETRKNEKESYLQRLIQTEVDEYHVQQQLEKALKESQRNTQVKAEEEERQHKRSTRGAKTIKKSDKGNNPKEKKRMNERPIGYVIDKVCQWRQLFIGKETGGSRSLAQAADIVGISKKSLDDYTLHLRKGFKYFFNFNEHRHSKIGVLRDFVKKAESREAQQRLELELTKKKSSMLQRQSSTLSRSSRNGNKLQRTR